MKCHLSNSKRLGNFIEKSKILSFHSNLRRKWSGKLATFPSDVGAWKGEVFFSKSDHSKNYPGSQLLLDIRNESIHDMSLSIGSRFDLNCMKGNIHQTPPPQPFEFLGTLMAQRQMYHLSIVGLEHQWSAAIKEPLSPRVFCRHVAMSDNLKIKLGLRKRKYVFTLQQMSCWKSHLKSNFHHQFNHYCGDSYLLLGQL